MIDFEAIRARNEAHKRSMAANPWLRTYIDLALGRDWPTSTRQIENDVDALIAEVGRKGMRLFEITNENIKLRAEVERLNRELGLAANEVERLRALVADRPCGMTFAGPKFCGKPIGHLGDCGDWLTAKTPDLAAKIRRFNGSGEK